MEPADQEGGAPRTGRPTSPARGPVPEAPTPAGPGIVPVEAAGPAGAGGSSGSGAGLAGKSPPARSPAAAASPQQGAPFEKQQLLQQLLAVAAAAAEAPAGLAPAAPAGAGAAPAPPLQQHIVPFAAAAGMPPFLAQQAVPLPFGVPPAQIQAPPAPKLSLEQLLQAQLAANHAQREATPEQAEAAAGEEMMEAGLHWQPWEEEAEEEEEEEEGEEGPARKAARRERNRQAAARYRLRQKEQRGHVAAQLEAAQAQRTQLLAERQQLAAEHLALARMEAVQRDLHHTIVQLCRPEGNTMAAALTAAAAGTSLTQDTPPAFPSGQAAQLIEQAEQQFAEELRQVVEAGDHEAQAAAALRLLPATHHASLGASPAAFAQQCSELQRGIHQLLVQQAQQQQAQQAQQQPGAAVEVNFPVRLDAMHKCAMLRKLLVAMALAAPSPDKLLHLVAASASAPADTWRHAAASLLPTLCNDQLEQLRQMRHQWVGDMGRVLAARGYQLSRLQLQSWQAAAAAMQPAGAGAGAGAAPQAAEPAGPPAAGPVGGSAAAGALGHAAAAGQPAAGQPAAAGGQSVSAAAAVEAEYGSMAAAAVRREQLLRGLRGLDDTSQRCFGCLVALIVAMLQVMTLWQCTMLLAACYPYFPDPAAILAQLLDCDDDPPQQAQQAQLEELPASSGDVAG